MKITEGREFIPQLNKKMNTVQFNYFLNGELVNVKFRTGNKLFKLVPGAELILWNIDSIRDSTECVITEGEMDTLSYIQAGYPYAVSVPNGANVNLDYLDEYIDDFLENKEVIYIATDADKKGISLQNELVRRLGADRCRIVSFDEGCKDANEHLVKCGTHSLLQTLKNAQDIKVAGIFRVSDFETDLDLLFESGLQKGVTTGHGNFDRLCSFETGRLLIATGIPGSGKSEFIDEIVELLNLRYGWKCGYFSPENYPLQIHASKLISKITGKSFDKKYLSQETYIQAKQYMEDNFFFIYPEEDFSLDTVTEKAGYLVKKKGIRVVVIDPWNKLEHQATGAVSETNYISKQLDKLHIFAQKHNCLVVIVAHPRKMNKDSTGNIEVPTLYDINGSANFFNKADFGITIHRDKLKQLVEVHVQKVKFKHLGEPGLALFKYNYVNGRFHPYEGSELVEYDPENHLKYLNRMEQEKQEMKDFFLTPQNDCPF